MLTSETLLSQQLIMDKFNKKGLLYPAMHKLYSALQNLEKFNKCNDFFDNISYLDSFFSEYRNITFVLQKSVKKTEFEDIYFANRDKYLSGEISKWFIDERNKVLKEHPFKLEKRIKITLYAHRTSIVISEKVFNIENDVPIDSTIENLKILFNLTNSLEVFFSVEFSFYEEGSDKDLLEDLIVGVHSMIAFMNGMKNDIGGESSLCCQLQEKINNFNFFRFPKEFLFIDDYVYNGKNKKFEKATKGLISPFENPTLKHRFPLVNLRRHDIKEFDFFVITHCVALREQNELMPTFYIIYEDDMFEIVAYFSSIKTVTYRKINEIAGRIKSDKIKQVYYATEAIQYKMEDYSKIVNMTSMERGELKEKEVLACYKLDKMGDNKAYYFDRDKVGNMEYVSSILNSPAYGNSDDLMSSFLCPIINSFKESL